MSLNVESVGKWLLDHIDELFERFPELKKKLYEKLKEEMEERITTKDDILAVLTEIKRLREDFNRQERRIDALYEEIKRLREDFNRQERRIDALYEEIKRLREDFNRQQERVNKMDTKVNLKLSAIGARWGILSERAFREGMRFVLENYFNAKVSSWRYFDSEGFVYGTPTEVEIDVLIKDSEHILIEIKASADVSDVAELRRIGILYEKIMGLKPKLILVSPFVTDRALNLAEKLGIKIIPDIPV